MLGAVQSSGEFAGASLLVYGTVGTGCNLYTCKAFYIVLHYRSTYLRGFRALAPNTAWLCTSEVLVAWTLTIDT